MVIDDVERGELPRLGIPVSLDDAERCAPHTFALVRGTVRLRGRVVLDFPDLILWPIGRIERLPEDAEPADPGRGSAVDRVP